jgi:hypothetical protein
MVNTASFPSGGALVVRGARGRGLLGEARAKNTIRVGYSHTYSFSVRASKPSIMGYQSGLSPLNTFPLKAIDTEAESA